MTFQEARDLARQSQVAGYKTTVPLGWGGPDGDGYFARIICPGGVQRFQTRKEWQAYHDAYLARQRVAEREVAR